MIQLELHVLLPALLHLQHLLRLPLCLLDFLIGALVFILQPFNAILQHFDL